MARTTTLVRLSNWIGDVIQTVPSLQLLQAHGHDLVLVGKGWSASLLQGTGWPVHKYPGRFGERRQLLKRLKAEAQLAPRALCFPNSLGSALELRLAGLQPVGYRKEGRGLLLADSLPLPSAPCHELERHWRLACRFLGVDAPVPARIELPVSAAHRLAADELLRTQGVRAGYLVIAPFAASDFAARDKKWPHFPAFTQAALQRFGRDIVVCPGPGEEALVQSQHAGTIVLRKLDLGTYLGVLSRAALVVANDTGPGHMAAAVGVPLISVLGPSNPAVFGAWGPNVTWMHDPAWSSLPSVLERAEALLQQRG